SDLRGEQAWPTQPFPAKPAPLMRQAYTEADVSNISPQAYTNTLERIRLSPNFGPFPTPSLKETIMFPGFDGGMEWGGGAADSDGVYYVNINEIPWVLQMVETRRADGSPLARGERDYMLNCAACHGLDQKGNPAGGMPSLIDVGQRKTRDQIVQVTKQGFGRMPAFDRMADGQHEAVIAYVLDVALASATRRPDAPLSASPESKASPYAFAGFRRWTDQQGYP